MPGEAPAWVFCYSERDRHLLEVGDGEGPGFHQSAVGRVDPAVGPERRQHHLRPRQRGSRARLGLVLGRRADAVERGPGRHRPPHRLGLVALFPLLRRQVSLAFAFCGVATLAAAGAMLAFPSAF
jgi:hypothetical protein